MVNDSSLYPSNHVSRTQVLPYCAQHSSFAFLGRPIRNDSDSYADGTKKAKDDADEG